MDRQIFMTFSDPVTKYIFVVKSRTPTTPQLKMLNNSFVSVILVCKKYIILNKNSRIWSTLPCYLYPKRK